MLKKCSLIQFPRLLLEIGPTLGNMGRKKSTTETSEITLPASPNSSDLNPKRSHRGVAAEIREIKFKYPELTNAQIARRVGCDPSNVTGVLKNFLHGKTVEDLRDFQSSKVDILETLVMRILESVTPEKIEKTSAAQLVTMAAILQDKIQLLNGNPTAINGVVLMDLVEAIKAKRQAGDVPRGTLDVESAKRHDS